MTNKYYNLRKGKNVNYCESDKSIINKNIKKKSQDGKKNFIKGLEHDWNNFNNIVGINKNKKFIVSATGVSNHLLNDPLLDWLKYNESRNKNAEFNNKFSTAEAANSKNKKLNLLFEKGNEFEKLVIDKLREKFPGQVLQVSDNKNIDYDMSIVKNYMSLGIPILVQVPLHNPNNGTYGVADLVIRSDWFKKIFEESIIPDDLENHKAPLLEGNYHYRVIDIKWTTMYLCANGRTIRNSGRFPAYKGQLTVYNAALGLLQGYTPDVTYILSKGWNINNGEEKGYNCFDLVGHIEYDGFDNKYIDKTKSAIEWINNMRENGDNWSIDPPSVPELYPNMNNHYDAPYCDVKKDIAAKVGEITEIWQVTVKNRKSAHDKKIYSWRDDRCTAKTLNINGKKIAGTVDKILEINRSSDKTILPEIIVNNSNNWQTESALEFYIDFESITGCLYDRNIDVNDSKTENNITFMVGVWHKGSYKNFCVNEINSINEYAIFSEFVNYIESFRFTGEIQKPKLFHWGNAERTLFNAVNKKNNYIWSNWLHTVEFIDMCTVFTNEPIVIKGAKKFGLKEIGSAMKKHGMISVDWKESDISNGLDAMIDSIKYFQYMDKYTDMIDISNTENQYNYYKNQMNSIIKYNEIDCTVVQEIVAYLRKNHTVQKIEI